MNRSAVLVLFVATSAAAAPPPMARKTMSNGLDVIVVENHAQPLVTLELAVRNGSMTEPPDYNGLSHLYEHMFFKANQALPSQEQWLARARSLGIVWNGTTDTERVNYFVTTTTDHLAAALEFMRDATVGPLFDPQELEKERVVVTGEIDRAESDPSYYLWHETLKAAFAKHPSRKDPLGNRQTVLKASVDQMKTIQQRYYVPNNSALIVTGDVKADEIFALSEQLFGATWKRGDDPFVKHPLVKHPPIAATSVVLVEQPVQTVAGMLIWHGPSVKPDEMVHTYASDLLTFAAREPSSKFQRALVDSGACVGVGLGWYTQTNVGPITLSFEATPDRVDACITAALAELPKIKDAAYFSDDELKNAVFRVEMDDMHAREKPSQLAHLLSFWWTTAGLDYYVSYVPNLKKATRAHIATYLERYMIGKPYVLGVMVSPEMSKRGLDRAHFEKLAGAGVKAPAPTAPAKGATR